MALPAGVSFGKNPEASIIDRQVPLWLFAVVAVAAVWGWWRVINPTATVALQPYFGRPLRPRWTGDIRAPDATLAGNVPRQPPFGRRQ